MTHPELTGHHFSATSPEGDHLLQEEEGAPSVVDLIGQPRIASEVKAEDLLAIKVADAKLDCVINPSATAAT